MSDSLRVLLVHKFHRLVGGAEVFYFGIADLLRKNGHRVAFFSTEGTDNISTGDPEYFVPPPEYASGSVVQRLQRSSDIFYSQSKRRAFDKAIAEFEPDLIHVFALHVHLTPAILEAALDREVPVVMSCNDYKHICPNYKLYQRRGLCERCKGGRFYQAVLQQCCKNSLVYSTASALEAYVHKHKKVYDRLVGKYLFSSQFMLNKTKEFWSDRNVRYGILHNPFDAGEYEAVYEGDYALYFGRIIEEKGVDRLIEAAKCTRVPIRIIGDGPDLATLKDRAADSGLDHVTFLGARWGDELTAQLSAARFVIVPSLWHENFPYVIFQSFAAGKPVIGSLRGGIPELIGADRGILFEPDNIDELVTAIEALWNDTSRCAEMGKHARAYVETTFSEDAVYNELMNNYRSVLS